MKQIGKSVFFVTAIISVAIFFAGFFGISSTYGDIVTDIVNGVHLVPRGFGFENEVSMYLKLDPESEAELNYSSVKQICEKRLELSAVVEFDVFPDIENEGVRIVIPQDINLDGNLGLLGRIMVADGLFEVREGMELDDEGNPTGITENVILTNKHVKSVRPMVYNNSSQGNIYYLEVSLTSQGRKALRQKAENMVNEAEEDETPYLSVWVDGEVQDQFSASQMLDAEKITLFSGSSSGYSLDDISAMSISISSGRLGVPLRVSKIIVGQDSGFVTGNKFLLLPTAFALALLLTGVALFVRYKYVGLCGFISLLGCFGFMFIVLTSFYGNPATMQVTSANIGAFLIVMLMGVMVIVRDGESVKESMKQGVAFGKSLGAGYGKNLSSTILSYCAVFISGLLFSDLFKRTGGLSAAVIKWIWPSFSAGKYVVLGQFGTLLWVGAVFSIVMIVLTNRLMIKSLISFNFVSKSFFFRGPADEKL